MNFGERLILARGKKGLTQKRLSEILEITPTRLNYWEKNKREPSVEMIKKIAKALDTTGDFLIGNEILPTSNNKFNIKENNLLNNFNKLNEQGKEKAIERVEELTEIPKYTIDKVDENKITPFKQPEQPKEKVKIIARGEGITYIDKEELDEIKRNSTVLSDEDFHKYF